MFLKNALPGEVCTDLCSKKFLCDIIDVQKGIYSGNKDNSPDAISGGSILRGKEFFKTYSTAPQKDSEYDIELPQSVIDSFARFIVPEIREYYESEEGKKAFKEWQQTEGD